MRTGRRQHGIESGIMNRTLRKWLVRGGLLTLAGLLTTIAVAWSSAALVDPTPAERIVDHTELEPWAWRTITTQTRLGHTRINRIVGGLNVADNQLTWHEGASSQESYESITQAGFPLPALQCFNPAEVYIAVDRMTVQTNRSAGAPRIKYGIELPRHTTGQSTWRALPLQPMWRGLIINTLVFAALWALLLFAGRGLIIARRAQRGWCIRCAYDLRGSESERCPECGFART